MARGGGIGDDSRRSAGREARARVTTGEAPRLSPAAAAPTDRILDDSARPAAGKI